MAADGGRSNLRGRPSVQAADPLTNWGRLLHDDTRRALGAYPRKVHQPDATCAYCWPPLIQADLWDDRGNACCATCNGNPNRVRRLPYFGGVH